MPSLCRRGRLLLALLASAGCCGAAESLFDETVVHDIRLYLDPADWQALKANYLENTYYGCALLWRGQVAWNAAVRSRGNGSRDGVKPALRLDFNRYEPGQEFAGLTSLILGNLKQDPQMIRSGLALLMFRRMGHPTPRSSYARLYVNDSYAGLYQIVEPVDEQFLIRNFGKSSGYLYSYQWAFEYHLEYLGADASQYVPIPFEPETHEKSPEPETLVEMIRTINQAPDEDFAGAVGRYLDLKRFAEYLAVENFVAGQDGIAGAFGINNFYLHRRKGKTVFQFIPWDQDDVFVIPEHPIFHNLETNVLTRRLMALPEMRRVYLETLLQCADLADRPGTSLVEEIQRRYDLIRTAALEDTFKVYTNQEFESDVAGLLWSVGGRGSFVREAATAALNAAQP